MQRGHQHPRGQAPKTPPESLSTQRPGYALPANSSLHGPSAKNSKQRWKQETRDRRQGRTSEQGLGERGPHHSAPSRCRSSLEHHSARLPSRALNWGSTVLCPLRKGRPSSPLGPSAEGTRKTQLQISFQITNKNREAFRFQQNNSPVP